MSSSLFTIAILGIVLALAGVFFLLKAVWELRKGESFRKFMGYGMIAATLWVLMWGLVNFPLFSAALGSGANSSESLLPGASSQSSTSP
ncbi:hypothetical protein D2Q93_16080 [Alicyclobacillaceae bacterium I2511]|nr:hypothetical protein D2Q93_16080 [Alicyclobacillaceae bacterium I2511]